MASKARYTRIFIDNLDVSAQAVNVDIETSVAAQDVTTFQATGVERVSTDPSTKVTLKGYIYTLGVGDLEKELYDRLGVANTVYVGVLLADSTTEAGAPVYVLAETSGDALKIGAPANNLITVDGGFTDGDVGRKRGVLLWRGAISATGTKPAVDIGAAGTAGGDVYVFVQSITGTATNAAIAVESATTQGGSYSAEATATFSAAGAIAAAMTGTVNRWLRINTTSLGGATAFTVAVVACVDGVTQ